MNPGLQVAAFLAVTVFMAHADIAWPVDSDWFPLMRGTDFYSDPRNDHNPAAVDLIGTVDTYSAGYWAFIENGDISGGITNDAFMFRLRVGGESGNFVWQTHLDTDSDASNIEWIFQLVQSGSGDGVTLVKTAIGGTTLDDIDTGSNTPSWVGNVNLYSRWTAIASSTDFHVDFAIPWSEFSAITGVTNIMDIRAVLSTSTTHANVINGDTPLGLSLSDQVSNVLSDNIPEPAVVTLLLGAGGGILASRRIFKRKPEEKNERSI